jgi:hypothetical protein
LILNSLKPSTPAHINKIVVRSLAGRSYIMVLLYVKYLSHLGLLNSVDNFETQKKEFQALMKEYEQGNLDKIYSYALHPIENNPIFY